MDAALPSTWPVPVAGCRTLALGGFVNHRKPIALLRALAAHAPGWSPESLVLLSASVDLDLALLLFPGIREVHCPFQGIEGVAASSPLLQARLRTGTISAPPWDTGLLCRALSGDTSPVPTGLGTDLPALNPSLTETSAGICVRPLPIDLALLHLPGLTAEGLPWWPDSPWGDALLWERAQQVWATSESSDSPPADAILAGIRSNVWSWSLPAPTWPTAAPPNGADLAALQGAVQAARQGPEPLAAWWEQAISRY